jgi:hypothetical protein
MTRNNRPYRCLGDFGIWSAQIVSGSAGTAKSKDVLVGRYLTIAMDALNNFNSVHQKG